MKKIKTFRKSLSCVLLSLLLGGCGDSITGDSDGSQTSGEAGVNNVVLRASTVLEGEDALAELSYGSFDVWAWTRDSLETTEGSGVFNYKDELWIGSPKGDGTIFPESVYHLANGIWATKSDYLWPLDYYACDFFALYPANYLLLHATPRDGTHRPLRYIEYDNATNPLDLLAASMMCKKEAARINAYNYYTINNLDNAGGGMAPLNFHHVLSKINFKARRVTNTPGPQINVTITSVTLCNIQQQGTFTFHDLPQSTSGSINPVGWWTLDGTHANVTLYQSETGTALTTANQDYVLVDGSSCPFVIPQTRTAWDLLTAITATTGTYLKIGCQITIDGYDGDFSDEGYVYVPFSPNWAMGKNYTYTLHFGGGYDHDGHLILQPVTLTSTITPWASGNTTNPEESWL